MKRYAWAWLEVWCVGVMWALLLGTGKLVAPLLSLAGLLFTGALAATLLVWGRTQ